MSLCLSALFGDCVGIVIAYKDSTVQDKYAVMLIVCTSGGCFMIMLCRVSLALMSVVGSNLVIKNKATILG